MKACLVYGSVQALKYQENLFAVQFLFSIVWLEKTKLTVQDLYGESLMLIHRGWSQLVDRLRDDIWEKHSQINIVDFDFYDVGVFNRCECSNDILMAVRTWMSVHPLMKIIPVEWEHEIPYGLLHSQTPSPNVQRFLDALRQVIHT